MAEHSKQERREESRPPDFIIIKNSVEEITNQEEVEQELERALALQVKHIIIEPVKLGDETSRWIRVGNFIHKGSVVSGVLSILTSSYKERYIKVVALPLGVLSFISAGIYAISWASDPCCKYQIEYNVRRMEKLPLQNLSSTAPVVLVRRDDSRRKYLQNIISLSAVLVCAFKLYKDYSKL